MAPNDPRNEEDDRIVNSPISEISQELLSYILDIVRNEFEEDTDEDREGRLQVVTTASQVSNFWRFVAFDHPLWWTELTIYPAWNLAAIDTHLKQSQQCLLDLRISSNTPYYRRILALTTPLAPSEKDCLDLLELIFPHLHRCRVLQIDGIFERETIPLSGYLDRFLSMTLPVLESLTLDVRLDKYRLCSNDVKRSLFTSAPLLRNLYITGVNTEYINLPSTTLTTLHLSRGPRPIGFVALAKELEACKNLTELAIYNDAVKMLELHPHHPTCSIPSLKVLLLMGNVDMVSELLVVLDTPQLEELVIAPSAGQRDLELYRNMKDTPNMPGPKPHFPNLRRLTVAPLGPEDFTEVIEEASAAFPLIEHLTFVNLYLEEFRSSFTSTDTFFPKVVDLALTDVDITFADAILAIGKFRLENGVPLKNLILDSSSFTILSQHPSFLEQPYFKLKEENLWETRRRTLLNSEVKDLYIGKPRQ